MSAPVQPVFTDGAESQQRPEHSTLGRQHWQDGGLEPLTPHSGWGLLEGRMEHRLLLTQSIPWATPAGTGLGRAKGWGDGALPDPAEGHTVPFPGAPMGGGVPPFPSAGWE